jgi:hypothetical protein
MVVVLELRKGEKVIPIILTLIDEDTEILLEFLIDSFRLAVPLGVISRGSCQFDSEESVQLLSELGNKLGATIGNHFLRKAMKSPDMSEVQSSGTDCGNGSDRIHKMSPFSDRINHHHDAVFPIGLRKF